ncbi:MAG: class I SAM-dependent methyltransferase [Bacteroidota bacterium]|nr:class I SAM-dependent methyltransferase [Bacteroidota bacterium]
MEYCISHGIRYLRHFFRRKSKFDLHSPFVYKIYSRILQDKSHYREYEIVERMRSTLFRDPGFIKMTDLGSGSPELEWNKKIIPVHKVVKKSCVPVNKGRLLFRIARHFQPSVILELGTSLGVSTSYLALGAPDSQVITIEGCQETLDRAIHNFDRERIKNIRAIHSGFDEVLPYLLPELGYVDMVFFDGNHRKEATLNYFSICLPFVRDDTVFIFDDIHWSAGMESAWYEICSHPEVKVTIDLFSVGLVFFREGLSKEDFLLGY